MKCLQCGTNLKNNEVFCPSCGFRVIRDVSFAATPQYAMKKNRPNLVERFVFILGMVVLVIQIGAILWISSFMWKGLGEQTPNLSGQENGNSSIINSEVEELFFESETIKIKDFIEVFNSENHVYLVEASGDPILLAQDRYKVEAQSNISGNKIAVLVSESSEAEEMELYYYSSEDKKVIKVAENVHFFKMPIEGTKVFYTQNYDREKATASLFVFSPDTMESEKIVEKMTVDKYADFAISPDGNTVIYPHVRIEDSVESKLFYIKTGNDSAKEWGHAGVVYAVSDDAKYVYYSKNSVNSLYVSTGGSEMELSHGTHQFFLNQDLSEIIFAEKDNVCYSYQANPKVKLYGEIKAKSETEQPQKPGIMVERHGLSPTTIYLGNGVNCYEKKSFIHQIYEHDKTLYRIKNSEEIEGIASERENFSVSQDGKEIFSMVKHHEFEKMNLKTRKAKKIASNVKEYWLMADDSLYYIDLHNQIFYVNQEGKTEQIMHELIPRGTKIYDCFASGLRDFLFIRADDELYYIEQGIEKNTNLKIKYNFSVENTLFVVDVENALWRHTGGKEFEKVLEKVER